MIKMYVADLSADKKNGKPMVVLTDEHRIRYLPILLAPGEVETIELALKEAQSPAINTQNLALRTFAEFGYAVTEVLLQRQDAHICGGLLKLSASGKPKRNGDPDRQVATNVYEAICMSARCHLPIWVPEDIVCEGSIPVDPKRDQEESKRFKQFVSTVQPSDFQRSNVNAHPELS